MKILITGAKGFIGSALIKKISTDNQILSLVRCKSIDASTSNISEVEVNLKNLQPVEHIIKKFEPDCLIHLAWEGLPNYSLDACHSNLNICMSLLKMIVSTKIPRVFFAGTCWEYGLGSGPQKESNNQELRSIFALTKQYIFSSLVSLSLENNIQYRWGRIFFVYGPGQRRNSLLPSLWNQYKKNEDLLVNNPNAIQDFIYIDDLVDGIEVLSTSNLPSGAYNLGTGIPISVGQFSNIVSKYLNTKCHYPDQMSDDAQGMWADMQKTIEISGWHPKISINEGIFRTLEYYKKNS